MSIGNKKTMKAAAGVGAKSGLVSLVILSEDIQFDDLVTSAGPCFQAR
jgi:hypothetical protein